MNGPCHIVRRAGTAACQSWSCAQAADSVLLHDLLCFLMYCQDRRAVDRTFQKARTQPPSQPSPSVPSAAHLGEVGLLGVGEHPACLHIPDVHIADQVRHLQDRRLLSGVFVRKTLWPSKLQTSRSAPGSGSQMLDQQLEDGVFSCLWRIQTCIYSAACQGLGAAPCAAGSRAPA